MLTSSDWGEVVKFLTTKAMIGQFLEHRSGYDDFLEIFTATMDGGHLKISRRTINAVTKEESSRDINDGGDSVYVGDFRNPVVRVSGTSYHRDEIIMIGIAEHGVGSRWVFMNAKTGEIKVLPKSVSTNAVNKDSLFTDGFYMLRQSFNFKNCNGETGFSFLDRGWGSFLKWIKKCSYQINHDLSTSAFLPFGEVQPDNYVSVHDQFSNSQGLGAEHVFFSYGILADGPYVVYGSEHTQQKGCQIQSYYANAISKRKDCADVNYKIIMGKVGNETYQSGFNDVHSMMVVYGKEHRRDNMDYGASAAVRYIQRKTGSATSWMVETKFKSTATPPPEPFFTMVLVMIFIWLVNLIVVVLFFVYIKDNVDKLQRLNEKFNRHKRLKSLMARIIRKRKLKGKKLQTAMSNYNKNTSKTSFRTAKSKSKGTTSTNSHFTTAKDTFKTKSKQNSQTEKSKKSKGTTKATSKKSLKSGKPKSQMSSGF